MNGLVTGSRNFRPFKPKPPWWSGHLQTLRNTLKKEPVPLAGERLIIEMADGSGDRLWALLNSPTDKTMPLVILVHGLAGCETSSYITKGARYFLERSYGVLRLNLRGAGPSRPTCRLQSHAGRSQDLHDAILGLPTKCIQGGVIVIGFSLGGNMVLKFAAEYGKKFPIEAIVSVSAPIDLEATSNNMLRYRNFFYNRQLLNAFRKECLAPGAILTELERNAITNANNFLELDNNFVAPRNGYRDADDYWKNCQALDYLVDIKVPTLLIHAKDDPIVPVAPYLNFSWECNSQLNVEISDRGGHVGFHAVGDCPWHLARACYFLKEKC